MFKRTYFAILTALATVPVASPPAVSQPATQPPSAPAAPSAGESVSVPREVLERYVGRYELNGTTVTVGVTDDGRLTAQLAGHVLRARGA